MAGAHYQTRVTIVFHSAVRATRLSSEVRAEEAESAELPADVKVDAGLSLGSGDGEGQAIDTVGEAWGHNYVDLVEANAGQAGEAGRDDVASDDGGDWIGGRGGTGGYLC